MVRLGRVLLVLLASVGAACSSSSGANDAIAKDPAAALRAAARRTADGHSVKMDISIGSGTSKLATGEGSFDFDRNLGQFELSTSLGIAFEFVMTADTVYLKNPGAAEQGRKPWVAVSEETTNAQLGLLSQLRGDVDPREALKNLGNTVTEVKHVGTDEIRGETATHLRGRVDLSDEAIAKQPVEIQESLRQSQARFGPGGYPVDVWLDDDGRLRRFQYGAPLPTGGEATVRLDLHGYGEDTNIVVPKPDDVEAGDLGAG